MLEYEDVYFMPVVIANTPKWGKTLALCRPDLLTMIIISHVALVLFSTSYRHFVLQFDDKIKNKQLWWTW